MTASENEPYLRIVWLFDQDPTASQYLSEDGDGGFAGAVFRMARHIEELSAAIVPEGNMKLPGNAVEAEAMQKIGFAWLKAHAPDRLTEAGLASPVPAIVRQADYTVITPADYQLLDKLKRDNADGLRHVVEGNQERWSQGFRLSDAGLIAIEQHARGGIFHITRLGMKALETFSAANPEPNARDGAL
ncbi:hypothetical protein G6L37_06150 [Agrobacterium rubi]|nr:hypothetical protein [Agrobacterium rubi]NTF24943.1 hypothetical protein [Agrobacterium rubi]